jgi:hypothetical protein
MMQSAYHFDNMSIAGDLLCTLDNVRPNHTLAPSAWSAVHDLFRQKLRTALRQVHHKVHADFELEKTDFGPEIEPW